MEEDRNPEKECKKDAGQWKNTGRLRDGLGEKNSVVSEGYWQVEKGGFT